MVTKFTRQTEVRLFLPFWFKNFECLLDLCSDAEQAADSSVLIFAVLTETGVDQIIFITTFCYMTIWDIIFSTYGCTMCINSINDPITH